MNKNRKLFGVKLLSEYSMENLKLEDINVGDYVVAKIEGIDSEKIFMTIGNNKAVMSINDYDIIPAEKSILEVGKRIGSIVYARVFKINNGKIFLERKTVILKTMEYLKARVGNVIPVKIESIRDFGVFVDMGNGFISFVPVKKLSKCRYYNLDKYFKLNQIIVVKILSYENDRFELSRKDAYKTITIPVGECVDVTITDYVDSKRDAFFVEYDPANTGIMDIPDDIPSDYFESGDVVTVYIRKNTEKGFRCRLDRFH